MRLRNWALLLALGAPAASFAAQIKGEIRDPAGRPVDGARLTLGAEETSSNRQGGFCFLGALPGTRVLQVRAGGFAPLDRALEITGSDLYLRIDLIPSLPSLAYTVEVIGVAPRTAASGSVFRQDEFTFQTAESPAQALRVVPGLLTAQHAGGGKADQYLMRADHGAGLALYFDGIPVNMVSHAHGQGYADLHFVIPEVLETIDVYKGPYFAEFGNLAPAQRLHRWQYNFER